MAEISIVACVNLNIYKFKLARYIKANNYYRKGKQLFIYYYLMRNSSICWKICVQDVGFDPVSVILTGTLGLSLPHVTD